MTKTSQFDLRSAARPACRLISRVFAKSAQRAARLRFLFLAFLPVTIATAALGQALPAAEAAPISTGFALPRAAGTLNYAVSASEVLTWGYYGNQGAASGTNVSGDVGYLSNSKRYPFSMVFSGGHSWSTLGEPSYSFLNLALSQVINIKRWDFVVSDSVNYLPATPTTGLSGVPGVGDQGVSVGSDSGQGVLTVYSNRIVNTVSGSVQRPITGRTSFNAFGAYGITRFLDDSNNSSGLDGDSLSGGGGISHQLSARNTLGGNYTYSKFTYPGYNYSLGVVEPGFSSQTASAFYSYLLNRKISLNVAAGPQWTGIEVPGGMQAISLYASGSAVYSGQFSHISLSYVRSTSSGFGVVGGALSSSVALAAGRTFGRVWSCSAGGTYAENSNLPSSTVAPYSFETEVANVQVSRAIVRSLSAYANYTLEHQSSNQSAAGVDVFTGIEQVVGFGVTFSPSSYHLGRQ